MDNETRRRCNPIHSIKFASRYNGSRFSVPRWLARRSLISQRYEWIDFGGTAGGDVAGEEGYGEQDRGGY